MPKEQTRLPSEDSVPSLQNLTSSQLEEWIVSIDQASRSGKKPTSDAVNRFLGFVGLKSAQQVLQFLKTPAGQSAITLMGAEISKQKSLAEQHALHNREEAVKQQRRLLFLLVGLVHTQEVLSKQQNELVQQQMNKTLANNKKTIDSSQEQNKVALVNLQRAIAAYESTLQSLDNAFGETHEELSALEEELNALEEEKEQLAAHHAHIDEHLARFMVHLNSLGTHPDDSAHPDLVNKEQKVKELLGQVQEELQQKRAQYLQAGVEPDPRETDGLAMQAHGLEQLWHVLAKRKVLLDHNLMPVDDFQKAHFIVEPEHQARYKKQGNEYFLLPEHHNSRSLSESDWAMARENYQVNKQHIMFMPAYHQHIKKRQLDDYQERIQYRLERKLQLLERLDEINAYRGEIVEALLDTQSQFNEVNLGNRARPTPFNSIPEPRPTGSYALMLERLVPSHAPAPQKDVIKKTEKTLLEVVVHPEQKSQLRQLINEVTPGETMAFEERLKWLQRAKGLLRAVDEPRDEMQGPEVKF